VDLDYRRSTANVSTYGESSTSLKDFDLSPADGAAETPRPGYFTRVDVRTRGHLRSQA